MRDLFKIHDFVTFEIIDLRPNFQRQTSDIKSRYQALQIPYHKDCTPDLIVELGRFSPDIKDCYILDEEYYVRRDYLFHRKEVYKLGSFYQFDYSQLEGNRVRLRINANLTGYPFVAGRIIDFFLFYLLAQKGYSLIHASAVARRGEVFAFSGRGGDGKTTIAISAVQNENYSFLGDNFIICKDGNVYSFISDINIFGYNLNPFIWEKFSSRERTAFHLWGFVFKLTGGYIKIFSTVNPMQLFQNQIIDCGSMHTLVSLLGGNAFSVRAIDRNLIVKRTVSNMKLEFYSFVRHTEIFACIFPDSFLAQTWNHYENTLLINLTEGIAYYEATIPRRLTEENIDQIFRLGM